MVKLSGRGLGFTGGTVDKLKSVPGMRMDLDEKEVYEIAERVGAVVVNKAGNFAPADKIMYALRDVTATVDSIPLIVASIMSKKLAGGASHILLDVKTGSGALMKTRKRSEELAGMMVRIGELAGRHVTAFVTDMDVPLGHAVGNSLEVAEAVDTLRNRGPADLRELCVKFAGALLESAEAVKPGAGEEFAGEKLSDGSAFDKFKEMIAAQGGNTDFCMIRHYCRKPVRYGIYMRKNRLCISDRRRKNRKGMYGGRRRASQGRRRNRLFGGDNTS